MFMSLALKLLALTTVFRSLGFGVVLMFLFDVLLSVSHSTTSSTHSLAVSEDRALLTLWLHNPTD